jgi:hypothetical protein
VFSYRTTAQSTSHLTDTLYTFDADLYDPYVPAMHDTVSNTSRLVAAESGLYRVSCQVRWASNGTGERVFTINKNAAGAVGGGTRLLDDTGVGVGGGVPTVRGRSFPATLNAGDYIELFTRQGSGGSLNVDGGSGSTYLAMEWFGRQT